MVYLPVGTTIPTSWYYVKRKFSTKRKPCFMRNPGSDRIAVTGFLKMSVAQSRAGHFSAVTQRAAAQQAKGTERLFRLKRQESAIPVATQILPQKNWNQQRARFEGIYRRAAAVARSWNGASKISHIGETGDERTSGKRPCASRRPAPATKRDSIASLLVPTHGQENVLG
jgi:hypothetical protein